MPSSVRWSAWSPCWPASGGAHSAKTIAFHDQMRALWETHGALTHMVITSFVGNLPNLKAEETVLLHNQVDIGNAVKPYYGQAQAKS
jgi:hypothetical protein